MEGTASVIAIVTVGLQCSKFIYQIVSGIKGGPSAIQKVVTAVQNLSNLLERIRELAVHAKDVLGKKDARIFEDFRPMLSECVNELIEINKKLDKLTMNLDHRYWYNLKIYLHEKEVDRMWSRIDYYVQLFASQLSCTGATLGLVNTGQLKAYRREIKTTLDRQHDNTEAIASRQFDMLDGIHSSLNQSNTRDDELRTTLDKVSGQSDNLLSLSAAQFSEIKELVGTVQDLRLEMRRIRHDQTQRQHCNKLEAGYLDPAPTRQKALGEKGYEECIARLCSLTVGTRKETISREAQSVIHDLKYIIVSLLNDTVSPADARYRSMTKRFEKSRYNKCQKETERKGAILRITDNLGASRRVWLSRRGGLEDLKLPSIADPSAAAQSPCSLGDKIHTGVGTGHDLVTMYTLGSIKHNKNSDRTADTYVLRRRLVNNFRLKDSLITTPKYPGSSTTSTQFQNSMPSSELEPFLAEFVRKYDVFSWQTAAGIFDVQYDEHFLRPRDGFQDSEIEETIPGEKFSARVVFTPASTNSSNLQLVLNLSQKLTNGNNILSTPVLSFRSIIPKSSDVFRIVQYGSVHDLQKVLSEGSASLIDSDPKGRSLLNYALRALRPTMASFLIRAGADVNSYEVNYLGDMSDDIDLITAFYYEIECCSATSLKAFLDLGSPFIGPNSTGQAQADPLDTYPLLVLSVMHRAGTAEAFETAEKIALLLARGAHVNQKDSSGNICLHVVMDYSPLALQTNNLERQNELRDILMLMVTAGADICAVNDEKQTVSDIAHRFGHYQIWTEVLDTCGFGHQTLHRAHKADCGWSSAVDPAESRCRAEYTPPLSFPDYLEHRKRNARCRIVEDFEYSNAEDDYIGEFGLDASDYEDSEEEEGDVGAAEFDESHFQNEQGSKKQRPPTGFACFCPEKS
ncbi:hypothetical protein MMC07_000478 [Pseudocyphellaria aurata]|nr:hypothetical protein [Pseudocyphellaria aurata]